MERSVFHSVLLLVVVTWTTCNGAIVPFPLPANPSSSHEYLLKLYTQAQLKAEDVREVVLTHSGGDEDLGDEIAQGLEDDARCTACTVSNTENVMMIFLLLHIKHT